LLEILVVTVVNLEDIRRSKGPTINYCIMVQNPSSGRHTHMRGRDLQGMSRPVFISSAGR